MVNPPIPAPALLLIEDERSVMDFMRMALERHGYPCATANSAVEGRLASASAAIARSTSV